MTEQFVIEGGVPLSGSVRPEGNKNAALPILAACLLTDEEVRLANVPRIRDVEVMVELVAHVGADITWVGQNELIVRAARIERTELDRALCTRIRASILLAGPLLAREGTVDVPPPGGDVIGRRRVDTHFHAFRGLGAIVTMGRDFALRAPGGLRGARIFLDEPSVTGTENAIMAAVLAPGTTRLVNAACEPHVQDLCRMLVRMGARIDGIGSNMLTIEGVDRLSGCEHEIAPDHIEVASFVGPGRRHPRLDHGHGRRAGGPLLDPARASAASACEIEFRGRDLHVAAGPGHGGRRRRRRADPEDRGRALAAGAGRHHLDPGRRGHAGQGHRADLREDVREPAGVHGQARRPWAPASCSATRTAAS